MNIVIQALLFLTVVTGTFCRTLQMDNPRVVTPCFTGARATKDTFQCSAFAKEIVPKDPPADWSVTISVKVWSPVTKIWSTSCSSAFVNGACTPNHPGCMTCSFSQNKIKIDVNATLLLRDSEGILRLELLQDLYNPIYSDKQFTLPEIVDINNQNMSFTLNGHSNVNTHTDCQYVNYVSDGSQFQLCCLSIATPCYAQIVFALAAVAKDAAPCVTHNATSSDLVSVLLAYSLCTKTDYVRGSSCTMRKGVITTPPTTTAPTTTITTTTTTSVRNTPPTTTATTPNTTARSTNYVKTGGLGNVLWLIVAIVILAVVLSCIVYGTIATRNRREKAQVTSVLTTPSSQRPTTSGGSLYSEAQSSATNHEDEITEGTRTSSQSASEAGTDV